MKKFERYYAEMDGPSLLVEIKEGKGEVLFCGDEYHEKMNSFIDGYLENIKQNEEIEVVSLWTNVNDEDEFVWEKERKNEKR